MVKTGHKSTVRPSLCLSVRDVDVPCRIDSVTSKVITPVISLANYLVFAPRGPQHRQSVQLQRNNPQIRVVGYRFQQNTCNISKMGKIEPRLLMTRRKKSYIMLVMMTNRKLHTRFRVPKSTTLVLDDLERRLRILFQNTRVFRAHQ